MRRGIDNGRIRLRAVTFLLAMVATATLAAPAAAAEWPRFGGPTANFQTSGAELATSWPASGPALLWERELGPGYSGIAAADGVVYTQYLDGEEDVVIALQADSGEVVWEHRFPNVPREKNMLQFGRGPHATPLVLEDRLVILGYTGVLEALDRKTGKVLWKHDLIGDFGGEVLNWGNSASPIEHDGKVIVLVGGEAQGAVAFDPASGAVQWKSPPSTVSYATPIVIDVEGEEQLLYFSADELIALNPASGARLWGVPAVNGYSNHASMPIWGEDGILWVVTQQEGAARGFRLRREEGKTQPERLWYNEKVRVHHWNTLRLGDTAYASVGSNGSILMGVDVATGKTLFRERGFSKANFVHTASGTVLLDADGQLALVDLSPKGVKVRAQTELADGVYWTAPTLVGDRLYVRNKKTIRALDLGAE